MLQQAPCPSSDLPRAQHRTTALVVVGVVVGILATFPAVAAAMLSGGLGHGHYGAARMLFPIPMLLTRLTGDHIGVLAGGLALLQLPLYGAVLTWWRGRQMALATVGVLLVHSAAALACFSGAVPNFS